MVNRAALNAAELLRALKDNPGLKLKDFCAHTGLSQHFMEQIGLKLVKAKIISSKKGPGGGYSLAKETVSVVELLDVFTVTKKLSAEDELSRQIVKALTPITVV